jgi:hypothetical protein
VTTLEDEDDLHERPSKSCATPAVRFFLDSGLSALAYLGLKSNASEI